MLSHIQKQFFSRSGGTVARGQRKTETLMNRYLAKRDQSLRNQDEFYHYPQNDEYTQEIQRVQLYGKEQFVIGSQQDVRSPNFVLAMIGQFDPKSVVLGGLNKQTLKEYQRGKEVYKRAPKIYNSEMDLPAKETLSHFFQEDLEFGSEWFYQEGDDCIYRTVKATRQAIMEDHLSCGYHLFEKANRHLIFGKPDMHLVYEDLALRLSLKQLQDAFYDCVSKVSDDLANAGEERYPYFENERMYDLFRMKVRQLYQDMLWDKMVLYSASIFKQSARVFKTSAIIVPNELTKKLAVQTLEPMAPEWSTIFRAYIDMEKDKEFLSTDNFPSKKYSRTFKNIKRYFKDDTDYERIVKAAEHQQSKFDYYALERPLFERVKAQEVDADEILEKYVLINQLIEKVTPFYLEEKVNPFNLTIFRGLFIEKYGSDEAGTAAIRQKYEELNAKYAVKLHRLQNQQIRRIGDFPLIWRPELEQFSSTVKRIEQKPENYKYSFEIGKINAKKRNKIIEALLHKTMVSLLKKRERAGISQSEQIVLLKEYFEGNKSQENLKVYNELLLEASHTLGGIVKFPHVYKQFMPYLVNLRKYQTIKSIERKLDEVEEQVSKQNEIMGIGGLTQAISVGAKRFSNRLGGPQPVDGFHDYDDEEERVDSFKELFHRQDSATFVLGENPLGIPFDVKGKSEEELLELGFQPAGELEFQVDDQGNVQGVDAENAADLMAFLQSLKKSNSPSNSVQLGGQKRTGNAGSDDDEDVEQDDLNDSDSDQER